MKKDLKTDEYNLLIARFQGAYNVGRKICFPGDYSIDKTEFIRSLHYHDRWDWIMPVIKDINIRRAEGEFTRSQLPGPADRIFSLYISSEMEVVYDTIVDFIKWYNKNIAPKIHTPSPPNSR